MRFFFLSSDKCPISPWTSRQRNHTRQLDMNSKFSSCVRTSIQILNYHYQCVSQRRKIIIISVLLTFLLITVYLWEICQQILKITYKLKKNLTSSILEQKFHAVILLLLCPMTRQQWNDDNFRLLVWNIFWMSFLFWLEVCVWFFWLIG